LFGDELHLEKVFCFVQGFAPSLLCCSFFSFTNAVSPNATQQFYIRQVQ